LVHTLQQRGTSTSLAPAQVVAAPDDPLERQAERIAEQVSRDGRARPESWIAAAGPGLSRLYRQSVDAALPPGPSPEGDFVVGLGGGLKVKKDELQTARPRGRYRKDLAAMSLPGLKVKRLDLQLDREGGQVTGGQITAALAVPFLRPRQAGDARFDVDAQGRVSFRAKARLAVPALSDPEVDLSLADGAVTAAATITPEKLRVPGVPRLKIPSASVTLGLSKGQLSATGSVALEYPGLARGAVDVAFKDGVPAAKGRMELLPAYLQGVEAALEIAEGNLQGEVSVPASKLRPPVPGLSISEGTVKLSMKNGALSGSGEGIKFAYRSLGEGTLSFTVRKDHLEGTGGLALKIPGLAPVSGELRYRDGALSGQATITADKFPKGLPVKRGSITALVDAKGGISGRGGVVIDLQGVGSGELKLGYENGSLDLSAEVVLRKVPGLDEGRVRIGLKDGLLEGEGRIAVAPKQLPGLTGQVDVVYRDSRFSGKGRIDYAKDKIAGAVELAVDQDEKGKLALSGAGEVTARLTDWLTGQVRLEVRPDASIKIAGTLKADDIKLFPDKKADRELLNLSQNIPLWAILVAVIRIRTGVRAGVGPGMLRGVTATGEFGTGAGDQPAFSITGELFIPAYAEAYVAFGAGLGLDVVLGSLTGGIEAVATAGIYGAVSVKPKLAYEQGNWSISGVATLAAGAKVKLGLQAWAEIEALWVTVWDRTWKLGEWMWDVGPELGLEANVNYVFGRPEPPTFDFKTSDIDTKRLIQDAMPEDGPKGSGARAALKNTAAWKGALQEQNNDTSKIPGDLAAKSAAAPAPKAPPPRPARKTPPAGAVKDAAFIKAGAAKDLKGKAASPGAPAPTDKALQERVNTAFAALENLRQHSLKDPEDPVEIKSHLAELKAKHGFKTLEYRKDGEDWAVEAEINPKTSTKIKGGKAKLPPSKITYGAADARRGGTKMVADPLTSDAPAGSAPSDSGNAPIWPELVDLRRNGRRLYVRGHLLNHHVGGPGDDPRNLTPLTYVANGDHLRMVEKDIKRVVNDEKGMVHYEVHVDYPSTPLAVPKYFQPPSGCPAEGELCTTLRARWWKLVADVNDPAKLKQEGPIIDVPPIKNIPSSEGSYPHA
jgi:hypothetical protein